MSNTFWGLGIQECFVAGWSWLSVSHEFAVNMLAGALVIWGLHWGETNLVPRCLTHVAVGRRLHVLLTGAACCSPNMAAGFLQSVQRRPQCGLCPSLWRRPFSLPVYSVLWSDSLSSACAQREVNSPLPPGGRTIKGFMAIFQNHRTGFLLSPCSASTCPVSLSFSFCCPLSSLQSPFPLYLFVLVVSCLCYLFTIPSSFW